MPVCRTGRPGKEFVFHGYTLRPPDSSGGFLYPADTKVSLSPRPQLSPHGTYSNTQKLLHCQKDD